MNYNIIFFLELGLFLIGFMLFNQIKKFDQNNPEGCLRLFKNNNILGLVVFINILITKLY